jgi:hypothetical protein
VTRVACAGQQCRVSTSAERPPVEQRCPEYSSAVGLCWRQPRRRREWLWHCGTVAWWNGRTATQRCPPPYAVIRRSGRGPSLSLVSVGSVGLWVAGSLGRWACPAGRPIVFGFTGNLGADSDAYLHLDSRAGGERAPSIAGHRFYTSLDTE